MVEDPFEWQRRHRNLFGNDVDAYDDGRPGYPAEVYALLADRCGLGTGARVLEIGPGTGQATGALLDAGADVTAVELNPALAERLRAKYPTPRLDVVVGAYECVDVGVDRFDLVVAATSFHWVPAEAAFVRTAELLQPNGWLAVWWNVFGDRNRPDGFHDQLALVLARLAPELLDHDQQAGVQPYGLDAEARTADFDASGMFGPVHHEVFAWTGPHSATQLRAFFASQSPSLAIEPCRRQELLDAVERLAIDRFGGTVERPYLTPVYFARRSE